MESSSANRKIELQSPEDLTYLLTNVRRAAEDSINAAFPPVEGSAAQEDDLRTSIEQLVHEYISRTFTLAAPNLSINGLPIDAPEMYLSTDADAATAPPFKTSAAAGRAKKATAAAAAVEQYEPFDHRKRQRVEDLAREEEDLLREIAALKRRTPAAAAGAYAAAFRAALAADEDRLAGMQAAAAAAAAVAVEGEGAAPPAPLLPPERQGAVEGGFAAAVGTLERLKKDMPATVAKMERARVAGEYVVTEGLKRGLGGGT